MEHVFWYINSILQQSFRSHIYSLVTLLACYLLDFLTTCKDGMYNWNLKDPKFVNAEIYEKDRSCDLLKCHVTVIRVWSPLHTGILCVLFIPLSLQKADIIRISHFFQNVWTGQTLKTLLLLLFSFITNPYFLYCVQEPDA